MTYRPGDFWRICDVSGRKVRASETVRQWDGLIVHHSEFETRHPQDFVKGRRDRQIVTDPRPEPSPVYAGPPGGPWFMVEDQSGWRVYALEDDGLPIGAYFRVFGESAISVTESDF